MSEQNYIKAHSVHAKALAVGPNAQANSYDASVQNGDVGSSLQALRAALASLDLTEGQHALVRRDVDGLHTALQATPPDKAAAGSHLKAISDKLEFAGKAVRSVAGLVEPITKIATFAGVALKAVGLG